MDIGVADVIYFHSHPVWPLLASPDSFSPFPMVLMCAGNTVWKDKVGWCRPKAVRMQPGSVRQGSLRTASGTRRGPGWGLSGCLCLCANLSDFKDTILLCQQRKVASGGCVHS